MTNTMKNAVNSSIYRRFSIGWPIYACALMLPACSTIPVDPNIQTLAQIQAAKSNAQAEGFKSCAMANDVSACMLGIVAATAVSANQNIQYQRPPTASEQFIGFTRALAPTLTGLAGAAVSWRQSDNSRDVSIAQYGFLEGTIRSTTQAAATIAGSGPSINVGGNYGNTYGNDYTGGDRSETNWDDVVLGDRTDITNTGMLGDNNRQESDDNSHNGGPCTAAQGGISGTTGHGGDSGDCRAGDGG